MTEQQLSDIERRAGHVASPEGAALMRELIAALRDTQAQLNRSRELLASTEAQVTSLVLENERLRDRLTEVDY